MNTSDKYSLKFKGDKKLTTKVIKINQLEQPNVKNSLKLTSYLFLEYASSVLGCS